MRAFLNIFLAAGLFVALTFPLSAAELDSKLEAAAVKLTEAATARNLSTATLAVFPFQADLKLSKKRVNFAVSEMLTKDLYKSGKFTIIERAQLEEVLKEQKLGLSGAVDSKTAAGIGRLAGAKLLLLGNVIQLGNSYQFSCKLVDSGTGEMIASEIIEVPVKTFDEDADRYLVLVPESQAIGIYLTGGYQFAAVKNAVPATAVGCTITPNNQSHNGVFSGAGVRYFLTPKWMFDAAIMPKVELGRREIYTVDPRQEYYNKTTIRMYRVLVDRVGNISENLRPHFGAGLLSLYFRTTDNVRQTAIQQKTGEATYLTPMVRLGLEWKPRARIGLAVFGQYNLFRKKYKGYATYATWPVVPPPVVVERFAFPQFLLETTLSLYF